MRLAFLTSTPQGVTRGSGTYIAIRALIRALEDCGVEVELITPSFEVPSMTARRLIFNERLRSRDWSRFDTVVGFDMDGYRIAGRTGVPHVASIKGVIADEMQFEEGATRALLAAQAKCERTHVRNADKVLTTSCYSAHRIQQYYELARSPVVVPELIDLDRWKVERRSGRSFTVLSVCRFYRRKRIDLLLEASDLLRRRIPELEVRIVGSGPMRYGAREGVVWLGDVEFRQLQDEYAGADIFCLPSVQEGFGIVFLEAMAAGLPIVAAQAAAVPEVVPQGVLVEPESAEALADAIEKLYQEPQERERLRLIGLERVRRFAMPRIAEQFLNAIRC